MSADEEVSRHKQDAGQHSNFTEDGDSRCRQAGTLSGLKTEDAPSLDLIRQAPRNLSSS